MTEIEYQEFVRHCPYDAMGRRCTYQLNKPGNLANLI